MMKKNDEKNNCAGKLGYCPSSSFGSRCNVLYRDKQVTQGWEAGQGTLHDTVG